MANKKINQLVAKTTIQSTDLFPIGDATTGTLYKKTIADLQAAIGGAVISVNGLVGTVVLDADDILETATPTNRYFTEARARASISLTTSGSSGASTYSSSTGVLNIPTYTLAGLGGITATFLSGGTGITYNSGTGVISYSGTVYTDSSVRALFSGGTGITYNSSTGAISYSGTVYTDSSIRALFSGTSPITYNSTTGAIGITQATTSTNGYLSSTDWNTFNNKQSTITLTTTGISGAATFSAGTLNIPQYQAVLTNPVTGTGTSGYHAKFTGTSTIANSVIYDDGTSVGIGTTTPDTYSNIGTGIGLTLLASGTNTSANLNLIGNGTGFGGISLGNATIRRAGIFALDGSAFAFYTNATNSGTSLTERMRITSGGSIIINKTSVVSNERLSVTGSTNIWGVVRIENDTNQADVNHGTLNIVNTRTTYAVGNEASIMFSAFNSTASMQPRATIGMQVASDLGGHLVFNTRNDSGSGERMRITAGGNILLGTTTDNGERLYVSGAIRATGTITANSDISLKKNLAKIENALEKVEQINGYTYEFKEDDSKRHAGVIAQEIQEVLPEIVNKGNDGILGVEYGNISALLIEAIKEQQAQINELKALLNK